MKDKFSSDSVSSNSMRSNPISIVDISKRRAEGSIVALTAYTKPMAALVDPFVDLILVGDSLGMVVYGMESTMGVSLDMMINHGKAVMRGAKRACVVVDMPFGTYQESKEQAFHHAARLMQETNAQAVKLEGGELMAETVSFLVGRGIPVVGHVGLMPQYVKRVGGFKVQGKELEVGEQIYQDAVAIAEAGASALVIENTEAGVAEKITRAVPIPTIGIGASPACTGQILVTEDIVGMFTDYKPHFVKHYADVAAQMTAAVQTYAKEVRGHEFPEAKHCFTLRK